MGRPHFRARSLALAGATVRAAEVMRYEHEVKLDAVYVMVDTRDEAMERGVCICCGRLAVLYAFAINPRLR